MEAAESTRVVGTPARQGKEVAFPLTRRAENAGPFELLRSFSRLHLILDISATSRAGSVAPLATECHLANLAAA